jgi:hypothetical protein
MIQSQITECPTHQAPKKAGTGTGAPPGTQGTQLLLKAWALHPESFIHPKVPSQVPSAGPLLLTYFNTELAYRQKQGWPQVSKSEGMEGQAAQGGVWHLPIWAPDLKGPTCWHLE